MTVKHFSKIALAVSLSSLVACGGSSKSSSTPAPEIKAPVEPVSLTFQLPAALLSYIAIKEGESTWQKIELPKKETPEVAPLAIPVEEENKVECVSVNVADQKNNLELAVLIDTNIFATATVGPEPEAEPKFKSEFSPIFISAKLSSAQLYRLQGLGCEQFQQVVDNNNGPFAFIESLIGFDVESEPASSDGENFEVLSRLNSEESMAFFDQITKAELQDYQANFEDESKHHIFASAELENNDGWEIILSRFQTVNNARIAFESLVEVPSTLTDLTEIVLHTYNAHKIVEIGEVGEERDYPVSYIVSSKNDHGSLTMPAVNADIEYSVTGERYKQQAVISKGYNQAGLVNNAQMFMYLSVLIHSEDRIENTDNYNPEMFQSLTSIHVDMLAKKDTDGALVSNTPDINLLPEFYQEFTEIENPQLEYAVFTGKDMLPPANMMNIEFQGGVLDIQNLSLKEGEVLMYGNLLGALLE